MIEIKFSEEEIRQLNHERYHYPHPRVQRKMEALWLKSQKLSHREICRLTGISRPTFVSYLKDYKKGGIEKLKELTFYRPESELKEHTKDLKEYFSKYPPANIAEAISKIEELTGIKRSPTRVNLFLKSMGFNRRKVGMIPSKADVLVQEEFKKKSWSRGLKRRKKGSGRFSS